ncbi:hypothetical protein LXL04_016787 [Taraxacum kok-saghyz]
MVVSRSASFAPEMLSGCTYSNNQTEEPNGTGTETESASASELNQISFSQAGFGSIADCFRYRFQNQFGRFGKNPENRQNEPKIDLYQRLADASGVCRWQTLPLPTATPRPFPAVNYPNSVTAGRSPSTPSSLNI